MAAGRYFPSIHDERADNKNIWTYLDLKTEQLNSRPISFTKACFNKGCKMALGKRTQQLCRMTLKQTGGVLWRWLITDLWTSSARQQWNPGATSWSEDDDMCEINITSG
ncbi:hypothetical protein KUCAC02_018921 [Chaenocephalus aceratus]|uniref:Uncharacterized protein n=1 Tax=Chaenocephalus aceratus TaxID=36190 RepID=A0ACB9WBQ8_CHAAC|nr:hypothetical protein KUCAC02_018921 [Chaenocephalus aceratus]